MTQTAPAAARSLESYELLDEIGHGGMATVYRSRDKRLDRLVAVKVMHPHLRSAKEARVRFAREAKSVARLRHPNILEIYDSSSEDSEESYIVTELLTGPTLKEFAEQHREMPAEIAACLGLELARALGAAHAAGIVHRDVKPENVLLHEARCIKLTDFGIAQMVDAQSFTATGQILGSPGHMAPEQVEGGDCDARTDVFSLGTVLYYLATGQLPFPGKNPHQVLKRIVDGDAVDPLRVRPSIGAPLAAVIRRAMALRPEDRYPDARSLEEDLKAFLESMKVERPAEELARYLANPGATAAELRARSLAALLTLGDHASERGEIPRALEAYNRILALDDGNAQVLARLARLGRRGRRRHLITGLGLGLALVGVAALVVALNVRPRPRPEDELWPRVGAEPSASRSGGQGDPVAAPRRVPGRDAIAAAAALGRDASARAEPASERATAADEPRASRPAGPRKVVFRPSPRSVSISVDGAPARPFGPSFEDVELEPGPHSFRVEAVGEIASCCEPLEVRRVLAPGAEPLPLLLPLRFRPGGLYVRTQVPASVTVASGRASGRANGVVQVPLEAYEESLEYEVSAPGFRASRGVVRLRAGELRSERVDLVPAPAPPS